MLLDQTGVFHLHHDSWECKGCKDFALYTPFIFTVVGVGIDPGATTQPITHFAFGTIHNNMFQLQGCLANGHAIHFDVNRVPAVLWALGLSHCQT